MQQSLDKRASFVLTSNIFMPRFENCHSFQGGGHTTPATFKIYNEKIFEVNTYYEFLRGIFNRFEPKGTLKKTKIGLLLCHSHIELRLRLRLSWGWYWGWGWFEAKLDLRLRLKWGWDYWIHNGIHYYIVKLIPSQNLSTKSLYETF